METVRLDPTDLARAADTGGDGDDGGLRAYVAVVDAAQAVDTPWQHPRSVRATALALQHSWDGEPLTPYVATVAGEPVAAGTISTGEWDNRHLAWLGLHVHPDHRRHGHGSALVEVLVEEARARGRTTVGSNGWEGEQTVGFAARHGFEVGSVAVQRRQHLADLDWPALEALHARARERAAAYELVRRVGPTPASELVAVGAMSESINDAPIDDLDIEDENYSPERIVAYESAQQAQGHTLHRVVARHRATGELAGHTVVVVDGDRPELGHQHDTAVVAAHRGHRLGLLLKAEMSLWLREAQPQLAEVDTWNAASNGHMIGVNEALGYRVLGRQHQLQRRL